MPLMPQITSASTAQNCCSKTPAWAVTELLSKSHLLSWHYLRALPRAGKTSGDPEPYCWAIPQEGSTEKWGGGWFTWKESNPHLQGKEKREDKACCYFCFLFPLRQRNGFGTNHVCMCDTREASLQNRTGLRGSLTFSWAALGSCHPFSSFPSCNRDTETGLREASLH